VTRAPEPSNVYKRIYAVVRRIPRGRVATYGQVASLASLPGHARQVGYALHALRDDASVPWHRVINAQGRCSVRSEPGFEHIQQQLLEAEGVEFHSGRTSLEKFRWEPRPPLRMSRTGRKR
jgi:methylated-DNA-protein-cysteine methyltransferase-like protein